MSSGRLRRLIGLIDAGEILDLACKRPLVEALGIARDHGLQRRLDVNLDELALRGRIAHKPAFGPERRDEGAEHDQTDVGHEPRNLADTANILDAVSRREAKILIEAMAHVVAIKQRRMRAARVQLGLDQIGDGRFAGA